jgi:hypothetical protein
MKKDTRRILKVFLESVLYEPVGSHLVPKFNSHFNLWGTKDEVKNLTVSKSWASLPNNKTFIRYNTDDDSLLVSLGGEIVGAWSNGKITSLINP